MKKVIVLGSALACLAGIPAANAQIIIQPTIVEAAPAYIAEPAPVIVYPVHYDHHHYDWRYWHEHRDYDRR